MTTPSYPFATRLDLIETIHGIEIADPYRWLEESQSAETLAWSAAQETLYRHQCDNWKSKPHWERHLAQLLAGGLITAPVWRGERQFVQRRDVGADHPVLYVVEADGTERALVDPMQLDPAGTTTLDTWQPSKEGNLLAYQVSVGGNEESSLYVIDVATGEIVDGPISRARYSPVAWLPGEDAFYFVRRIAPELLPAEETQYHRRVYLHLVGTDADTDVEIFGAGQLITNYYGVSVSRDGRWLQVTTHEGTAPRNDIYLADLNESSTDKPNFSLIFGNVDAEAGLQLGRDNRFYVSTTYDAPRGRLAVTSVDAPSSNAWRDVIAEDEEAVLAATAIVDGPALVAPQVVAIHTRHAVSEMTVRSLENGEVLHTVQLPGMGTITGLSEHPQGGSKVWFTYTDYTQQPTVYQLDVASMQVTLWADAPGSVATPEIETQQITYTSKDGTSVRMFIVSAPQAVTQPRPTILYGYGGFNISLNPAFSAQILAWVAAGGVYAVANLRGGGEEGEEWHRAGMFGNKQNVFDDFESAAEWLITHGWTSRSQLSIMGGSNGGLLVGAALTQRPDLYAAVVCSAPLLDMVRYELHGLGATWNVEYGSASKPEELAWLHAYSPYHRVLEETAYPATLFTVFDGDTRVDPLHARKLCAALQHAQNGESPILIRAEANVGHGQRAVSKTVGLASEQLAFLAHHTGLEVK